MLKPFYNKKKNIDNRLLPSATAADAGKLLGVDEEGNITLVEGGGGGGDLFFPVVLSYDDTTETSHADMSYADIMAGINANKIPILYTKSESPFGLFFKLYFFDGSVPDALIFVKTEIAVGSAPNTCDFGTLRYLIKSDESVEQVDEYYTVSVVV